MRKLQLEGCNKEYLIDEDGNIFDIKENKYRKPTITEKGYLKMSFYINGKYKRFFIHRLVMMVFNPVENMDKFQINHIDGNKLNNNVKNLEWCTLLENMQHAWNNKLCKNSTPSGNNAHHKKINEDIAKNIREDLNNGFGCTYISRKYKISRSTVYQIKNNITWKK